MLTTNLPYVKAFLNPYLLGETRLHDNANTKKMLNKVLQKITNTSIAYAQALKEFTNFVKSQCLFLTPPKQMTSTCSHISVRIWLELVDTYSHTWHWLFEANKVFTHHRRKYTNERSVYLIMDPHTTKGPRLGLGQFWSPLVTIECSI